MYPLEDDSYGKLQLQQHTRFFSYTKPLEQSRHKIPFLLVNFLHNKVLLLYVCKLASKRSPLCWGEIVVNKNLTNRICRCWEAGEQLEPTTFWPELLSTRDATCSSRRNTDPASCTGAAHPGLLMGWQVSLQETELSLWPAGEGTIQGVCNLEQHTS